MLPKDAQSNIVDVVLIRSSRIDIVASCFAATWGQHEHGKRRSQLALGIAQLSPEWVHALHPALIRRSERFVGCCQSHRLDAGELVRCHDEHLGVCGCDSRARRLMDAIA